MTGPEDLDYGVDMPASRVPTLPELTLGPTLDNRPPGSRTNSARPDPRRAGNFVAVLETVIAFRPSSPPPLRREGRDSGASAYREGGGPLVLD
jgi:hypothetical protein